MTASTWIQGIRAPERAPQIVTGVLGIALAVQAAFLVLDLTGAGARKSGPPAPIDVGAPATRGATVDIATLVNAHLFGEAAPVAQSGDPASAAPTSMALILAGVLASDDPARGVAILGESAPGAKVYSVGQTVPGGAKLHAVYNDRVILDRNGALESLLLPRQNAAGSPLASTAAPAPAALAGNPLVERMRRLVADDPGAVGEIMRPQPVFAGGKQQGFRVYPGRNREAFARLGLRPGDLVKSINGTPLDDPSRGNDIFRTLSASSEAHVTVMRNGRQQDLVLNLSQVASDAQAMLPAEGMPTTDQQAPIPAPADDD